ncbi:MAG: ABC transporter permease [Solirubrobacteraceae bacterium]
MANLFGMPTGTLAAVLTITLLVVLGVVGILALRNRVLVRLGVRNIRRRPARSVLIVVGSMLGTAIIAAALATGDSMSQTIRSSATAALGRTDEVVAAHGSSEFDVGAIATDAARATGARYFPQTYADRIARSVRASGLVAGVAPVIIEDVAVQDVTARQNEPRVTLFASDPARMAAFGPMRSGGEPVSLAQLGPGEIYLNTNGAHKLNAHAGDTLRVLAGSALATVRVRAVVSYHGGGTDQAGILLGLAPAQRLLGRPGEVKAIFVANRHGVGDTARVTALLDRAVAPLQLATYKTKQEAIKVADQQGTAFMSMFTTFGSFSIAAGILLIFLIFVMLAAERRGELGIARAVGTRRRHLVQIFLYEGIAYDLIAAMVGALLGIGVAFLMVLAMASAFSTQDSSSTITFAAKPASVVIAYAIGVLLTLAVVAVSASRVSRMNIVAAIRNSPEPMVQRSRKRRLALGVAGLALGTLIAISGVSARDAVGLGFGVLVIVLSLMPVLRALGVPNRLAYTIAGGALILWFTFPVSRWLFGDMKVNFSIFVLGGLAIVIGASWLIVYNADLLLGGLASTAGRVRRVAPVLKMAMAYPLRNVFRTGVMLAMFTLVVFTLVTGAVTTGSFVQSANDLRSFGGGFNVRATVTPAASIRDMRTALAHAQGLNPADFRVVASESTLAVKARQAGTGATAETYPVHGVDVPFTQNTTYQFSAKASGYPTSAAIWRALRTHPGLAVVDPFVAPRKTNYNFAAQPKFHLSGFYVEDKTFAPVPVQVRDPQNGREVTLKVIGVLSDNVPLSMMGIWTSQSTLSAAFGARVQPTTYLFALRPGVDAKATAKHLESTFLANGMQADAMKDVLRDAVSASLTFDRLIMGFMGLGLIVGVAALAVISARSVVERRQQIGVLRAIGFRRTMVEAIFLLESAFVALTAILVGTALGLIVGHNVIADSQRQGTFANLAMHVPWVTLAVIFAVVFAVAMATTLVPARRAARVYPAEALRYQ